MSFKSSNAALIGQRYAKAFLASKATEQEIDIFLELSSLLVKDDAFLKFLEIQKFNKAQNSANSIINELSEKFQLPKKVKNFLMLISKKKRLSYLEDVKNALVLLINARNNQELVTLTLHEQVDEKEIEAMKKSIEVYLKVKPILDVVIDASILGGYVVKTPTTIIDNSVKKRIEKLHNVMKGVA